MEIWFEYSYSRSGEILAVTVEYFVSDVAANPFLTDDWIYNLSKDKVNAQVLRVRLYNRVREIEQGMEQWSDIEAKLNASQNTRINAESVFPDISPAE